MLLLALGLVLVFFSGNWRLVLFYTVFVGFAQDPLRKITPGQPQYLVGLVLVAAALSMLALYTSSRHIPFKNAFKLDSALLQYYPIFLWLLVISCLNSFLRTGAIEVPFIGVLIYLSPLLAIWLGFHFATRPGSVVRFIQVYIVMVSFYAFTVLLSFWGVASPLLTEVGKGLVIYLDVGIGLQGHTGLWRTAEVAAWHLGAAACFSIILGVRTRKILYIVLSFLLSAFLMYTSVLTGRRKVFTLFVAFVVSYVILISLNARRLTRDTFFSGLFVLGATAAIFVLSGGLSDLESGAYGAFFRRSTSVFSEANDRFNSTALGGLNSAIQQAGFFGFGVGTTYSSAATSIGAEIASTGKGGWVEGGLGKIIYEIGVVGFAFLGAMVFLLGRLYLRIARSPIIVNLPDHLLVLGLIAFLVSNLPNFSAASQVYNDFFVLLVLGLSSGFILGLASSIDYMNSRALSESVPNSSMPSLTTPSAPS